MLKLRIREIGLKNLECVGRLGRETKGRREKSKEREGKGNRKKRRVRYGLEERKGEGEGKEEYGRGVVRMRKEGKGKRDMGG